MSLQCLPELFRLEELVPVVRACRDKTEHSLRSYYTKPVGQRERGQEQITTSLPASQRGPRGTFKRPTFTNPVQACKKLDIHICYVFYHLQCAHCIIHVAFHEKLIYTLKSTQSEPSGKPHTSCCASE